MGYRNEFRPVPMLESERFERKKKMIADKPDISIEAFADDKPLFKEERDAVANAEQELRQGETVTWPFGKQSFQKMPTTAPSYHLSRKPCAYRPG